MLKNLHIRLTLICTACTAIIVILITVSCLYMSEKGLKEKEYGGFLTTVHSSYSHLQLESVITTEWYQKTIHSEGIILYIEDNGVPLSLVERHCTPEDLELIRLIHSHAAEEYSFNISTGALSKTINRQETFSFTAPDGTEYYAAAAFIPKSEGYLGLIIAYPLDAFYQAIRQQRLLYGGLAVLGIAALFLFSYWFTKRMIQPIELNREKQVQFIASASHELRSPLTVIGSSLSAMSRADEEKAARFQEIIGLELARMNRLVDDMLALSRSDADSWNLSFAKTDLNELIGTVYDSFLPLADQKGIHLNLAGSLSDDNDDPQKVISVGVPCFIYCDAQRLEQVLIILVDNALSYSGSGDTISLMVVVKKRKVTIKVADTGPGIPDSEKKQVFDRFYRSDPSRNKKEHYGLGLSIAREIIKLHKGRLTVADTPGGGATFIISGLESVINRAT